MQALPPQSRGSQKWPPVWERLLSDSDSREVPRDIQDKWLDLFDEFIKPGAMNELNLSYGVAEDARNRVREQKYTIEMFDQCRVEAITLLYENTFQKFQRLESSARPREDSVEVEKAIARRPSAVRVEASRQESV
ncbi:hypothetical protein HDU93_001909 [Gonapodya sp. JEL0774]|nr:hypothetical protein HDU93_001909 [Gonapodya sp. JEL0774]